MKQVVTKSVLDDLLSKYPHKAAYGVLRGTGIRRTHIDTVCQQHYGEDFGARRAKLLSLIHI